jgi:adenylate kinase
MLEKRVDILEQLPERVRAVELQIVQLREELRSGFSALRDEMRELFADNQRQMRILHEDVIVRIATIRQG